MLAGYGSVDSLQTSSVSCIWFLRKHTCCYLKMFKFLKRLNFSFSTSALLNSQYTKQTDRQNKGSVRHWKHMSEFKNKNQNAGKKLYIWQKKNIFKCQRWYYVQVRGAKSCICVISPGLLVVPCSWWTMSIRPLFVPLSNLSKEKIPVCFLYCSNRINPQKISEVTVSPHSFLSFTSFNLHYSAYH